MKRYTAQEFFNVVWQQAQKKKKCTTSGKEYDRCLYADGRGNACFIGATLDHGDYRITLEGESVATLLNCGLLEIEDMTRDDAEIFMVMLQEVHDAYKVEDWNHALRHLASRYKLEVPNA